MKVLFVCLGNICRSPIAQGIFEDMIEKNSTAKSVIEFVDSAGTADYHIGKPPDSRMRATAKKYGFDIDHLRGRQAVKEDFEKFDYIFAMDERNYENLMAICPDKNKHKVSLFLSHAKNTDLVSVPDPFHGNDDDFVDVLNLIKQSAADILEKLLA